MTPGPRILLTGATDGIGRALAAAMHARGVRVVAHGRSETKLAALAADLPGLEIVQADLTRLSEVRDLAARMQEPLDGLIANAGVFMTERVMTVDGFETTFQVNHLAHLRLILDLVPRFRPGARITAVASTSHEKVKTVDLENLGWNRDFEGYPAYGLAKLAQVGAVMELAPRLAPRGISIQALHPGSILTKLQLAGWGGGGSPDPLAAVERILELALGPEHPSGQWWVDGIPRDPNPLLKDPSLRGALFARSLHMLQMEDPCVP